MEENFSHFLDKFQKNGNYTTLYVSVRTLYVPVCHLGAEVQNRCTGNRGTQVNETASEFRCFHIKTKFSKVKVDKLTQSGRHIVEVLCGMHFTVAFQWPVLSNSGFTVQTVSPLCPNTRLDNLHMRNSPRGSL